MSGLGRKRGTVHRPEKKQREKATELEAAYLQGDVSAPERI